MECGLDLGHRLHRATWRPWRRVFGRGLRPLPIGSSDVGKLTNVFAEEHDSDDPEDTPEGVARLGDAEELQTVAIVV